MRLVVSLPERARARVGRALRAAALIPATCAVAALAAPAAGCSSHQAASPPPKTGVGVTALQPQGPTPTAAARARQLVQTANLQLSDLKNARATTTDPGTVAALDRHIVEVSRERDAVLADLPGRARPRRLDADVSHLERAMQAAAAATSSPPATPPPLERRGAGLGDDEALPDGR